MAKRERVLTPADRRAAEKVRALWADYQKKNPGISQEVAAARAGMGQSAFSQFLRGSVPMRVAPVLKFAKLFRVEPTEIRPDITRLAYAGARVVEAPRVEEQRGEYNVSDEALEIARAFDQLQPQAKEFIREQVFIYTVIDKQFPWLRHGKPIGKTYQAFERWHENNIATARELEKQRQVEMPRAKEKTKR
jgi:transcriptional regulator with XRE-family HTH domain